MPPKKRLVVIGAGFAGLSAARTIQGAGGDRVEVIVLEAQQTVGGRARSAKLPGGAPVELGATWFHGICGNPLYEIAVWEGLVPDLRSDPGLRKHHINWKVDFARPQCPQLLSGPLRNIAEEALDSFQVSAMELSGDLPAADESVGAFLRRKFDEAVHAHGFSQEELEVFAESWRFREKQQCAFDGFFCADDVSSIFPWEFETLDGPNIPVPGGLQAIAESLASPLDIRFEHKVVGIEWGSGGVSVSCSNGAEFEADVVLVTTSIGVLQAEHHTLFQPPLPDWKKAALSAVRLGVADKIFLEFDLEAGAAPFDDAAPSLVQSNSGVASALADADTTPAVPMEAVATALSTYEDPWNMGRRGAVEVSELTVAAAQAALPMTSGAEEREERDKRERENDDVEGRQGRRQRRGRNEVRTYAFMWPVPDPMALGSAGTEEAKVLLPGGLAHKPPPGTLLAGLPSWLYGVHSIRFSPGPDWIEPSEEEQFRAVAQGTGLQRPTTASAVLWITGDSALEMERLSDEEVHEGIIQLLSTFPSVPLPEGVKGPPRVIRTRWGLNSNFHGSYSYLRAGVEDGEVVDLIAEPLTAENGMPVVLFAGEATHRHYMGTVHGAYMSGFREANRFMAMEQDMMFG